METKLIYATDKEGNITHVDNVPNGIKCECRCPGCGEKLIARNNGKKQMHHFAHVSGADCEAGYQTSLHLLAKDIILSQKKIFIPAVSVDYNSPEENFIGFELIIRKELYPCQFMEDCITHVELEKNDNEIIPDVTIYFKNGSKLYVEIYVTHRVDETKKRRIIKNDTSCIEIDLSKEKRILTKNELTNILYDEEFMKTHSEWIYNKKIAIAQKKYQDYILRYCDHIIFNSAINSRSGKVYGYTKQCPRNGRKFLYGNDINNLGCIECDCNHGVVENNSFFTVFCSFNITNQISNEFGFGLLYEDKESDTCFLHSQKEDVKLYSKSEPIYNYCVFHNAKYFKEIKAKISNMFFRNKTPRQ